MKLGNEQFDRLIGMFRRIDAPAEPDGISPGWRQAVMRRIRTLPPEPTPTRWQVGVGQFVWRLAPVLGALMLILGAAGYWMDLVPEASALQLLLNGEEPVSITQLVGIE